MKRLLMLEDNLDRIWRFRAIVARNHPNAVLKIARTASDFKDEYWSLTETPDLICLDHDLFSDSLDEPDPEDGRDVSVFLITRLEKCPALMHSTNAHAADSMMFSMRDAGWTVDRIAPIGDDWIESYWYPVAPEKIARVKATKTLSRCDRNKSDNKPMHPSGEAGRFQMDSLSSCPGDCRR